jgi:hypothetical protein
MATARRGGWWWCVVAVAAVIAPSACGRQPAAAEVGQGAAEPAGYLRAFVDAGGTPVVGWPVEAVKPWGSQACIQRFRGGTAGRSALIQYTCQQNLQVFAVTGRLWAAYSEQDDGAERIGYPLGRAGSPYGFPLQLFASPAGDFTEIADGPRGTFTVRAPVLDVYLQGQADGNRFGAPTSAPVTTGDRVVQDFEHGRIDLPLPPT